MKRIVIIAIILVILASILVSNLSANRPHEGDVEISLCKANVYAEPTLTGSVEVLSTLYEGDTFTLTGSFKNSHNGQGARYTLWEGTTSSGVTGWVKANAFIEDSHVW